MMTTREAVLDIRKIHDANRLVIFVGSGVSRNSGIPTWGDLVRRYAEELGITKCNNCPCPKSEICNPDTCTQRYSFSTDEYLKIPQYYFDQDTSLNKEAYYSILRSVLGNDAKPNIIDDIILHAMPHHIITTNYDKLLESANDINTALYAVVSSEHEMISRRANNYIIKMHGDIEHPETVVLRERDYLTYETEHVLLSTFIKSLMIDHSFLFVGYSLNDYNLNIILEWINHLANPMISASERPKNYMIDTSEDIPLYRQIYFENKNVWLLKASDLPQELVNKHSKSTLSLPGKITYAFLDYIFNEATDNLFIDLKSILYEKYKPFEPFRCISINDLLKAHSLGLVTKYSQDLRFLIYDNYKSFIETISADDEKSQFIMMAFQKAGVQRFIATNNITDAFENADVTVTDQQNMADEILNLYINNQYSELLSLISNNILHKKLWIYYTALIEEDYTKCNLLLSEYETDLYGSQDWSEMLWVFLNKLFMVSHLNQEDERHSYIQKINRVFDIIPPRKQYIYGMWKEIFDGNHSILSKLQKKFNEHEQIYLRKKQVFAFAANLGTILEMQAIAYDYYLFIKENCIAIDNFTNPKNILEYYIHAIFMTYYEAPIKENTFLFSRPSLNKYEMNEIDVDIITKYGETKQLQAWVKQYNVHGLIIHDELLIEKFCHLCKATVEYKSSKCLTYLHNWLLLFSVIDITEEMITIISESFYECASVMITDFRTTEDISKMISLLLNIVGDKAIAPLRKYLDMYTNADILTGFYWSSAQDTVHRLASYADSEIIKKADSIIQNENDPTKKSNLLYCFRDLLDIPHQQKYKKILARNILSIGIHDLFYFVVGNYIACSKEIGSMFINNVIKQANKRIKEPNSRSSPDPLGSAIEYCIILHLLQKKIDISLLEPCIEYSDHLFFLLKPDAFDYSRVDSLDRMWINLFRQKKYRPLLIKHKNQILTDRIRSSLRNDTLTASQKVILYRYLLDDNEALRL